MNKRVIIKNIYYMLSYVLHLDDSILKKLDQEEFENGKQLLAYMLDISVENLIKQGLYKEYVNEQDSLKKVKGKININETVKYKSNNINVISCYYDELSINNLYNKIIKKTIFDLLKSDEIDLELKKKLKRKASYFNNIDLLINLNDINWRRLEYNTNNRKCELIINICYLIYAEKINSFEHPNMLLKGFDVSKPEKIFEQFILNYFKKHYASLGLQSSSKIINWKNIVNNDTVEEQNFIKFLPKMRTDVILENDSKVLIIDTKFYNHIYSTNYGKEIMNSNNLYQIYSYVNNYIDKKQVHRNVSGMLLYAKTEDENIEFSKLRINDNDFYVYCIDLNKDFNEIKEQVDLIYKKVFL